MAAAAADQKATAAGAATATAAASGSGSGSSSVGSERRALHWVFRVGDLQKSVAFYESVFGWKVQRHEEFERECDAACNGPFAGSWSKTMIGSGHEHRHFVLELTYNYGITSYALGNDYRHIAVRDTPTAAIAAKAKAHGAPIADTQTDGTLVTAPDGYHYRILPAEATATATAATATVPTVAYVSLSTASVAGAKAYWCGVLGMQVVRESADRLLVAYAPDQTGLEFVALPAGVKLDHAQAFGRIAFDIDSVAKVESAVKASGDPIQVGPLTLDTPGKATVTVIITRDRDGTEICHVERKGFAQLCDPKPGDEAIDWAQRATKIEQQTKWRAKIERMNKAAAAAAAATTAAAAPAAAATVGAPK